MAHDRHPFPSLVPKGEANPELREAFQDIQNARGGIGRIWEAMGYDPGVLRGHLAIYEAVVLSGWGLTRRQCELLGTVTSAANTCRYCSVHHGAPLAREGQPAGEVRALKSDPESAVLADPGDAALRDLALRLTLEPAADLREEMGGLAAIGFDDAQRAHAVLVVAYFNMMNRIANGLEVPLETDFEGTTR